MATEEREPVRPKGAALGREIDDVEARLYRRRADVRAHAGAVGDRLREAMSSPLTLVGAAGLGFAVAWFYPRRKTEIEDTGEQQGTSVLGNIMSGLNLAGLVMSLFPPGAGYAADDTDPR